MTHLGAAPLDSWLLSFKRNPRQERAFKSQRETDPRAATLRPSGGSHYAPPEPRGWSPLPLPSGSERRGKGVCVGGGAGGGWHLSQGNRGPKNWRVGREERANEIFSVIRGTLS